MQVDEHGKEPSVLAHGLLLRAELEKVDAALGQEGIDWVVLKGLPLAQRAYGSFAHRFCVDNDILVHQTDVRRAAKVLEGIGYVAAAGHRLTDDLATSFQHPMRSHVNAVTTRLELHWNAFPPHLFGVPEAVLWKNVECCWLGKLKVHVFIPELTLVHLASHYVQHRCAEDRILVDVGRCLLAFEQRLNWTRLERLARTTGTRSAVALVLRAAWEAGFAPAPPQLETLRANLVAYGLKHCRAPDDQPTQLQMAVSLALSARSHWLKALKYELFPPAPIMARIDSALVDAAWWKVHLARCARLLRLRSGSKAA